MSKKKLAVIFNINSNVNPALLFCLDTLSDKYDITVLIPDIFANENYPHINFISFSKIIDWAYRFLRIPDLFLSIFDKLLTKLTGKNNFFSKSRVVLYYISLKEILFPVIYSLKLLRIKNLDAVISIDAGTLTAARILKKFKNVPYIYWVHEIYPDQSNDTNKLIRSLMMRVERKGSENSDLLIVQSLFWGELIRRRYKLKNLKYEEVYVCPMRVKTFSALKPNENVKFHYHGVYMKGRGLKNLIQAMRYVEGGILYLRGIGDYEAELKEAVTAEIRDKVIFLPPVSTEKLAEEAAKFDIGVIMVCRTTLSARFVVGFKTYQNLAAGLALLAPSSFPLKALVKNQKVGVNYKDCKIEQLAEAMQAIIDNKEHIGFWKSNARNFVEKTLNIHTQQEKLNQLLDEIIK